MRTEIRKSNLTPPRRDLVEEMQRMRYGEIKNLIVHDGQPVSRANFTRYIRKIKIDGQNGFHPTISQDDMALKKAVVKLFEHLDKIGNGVVRSIKIGDGLPSILNVEEIPDGGTGFEVTSGQPSYHPPVRDAGVRIDGQKGDG